MKEIYIKTIASYLEMLEIHINTKSTDLVFHEKTKEFYEKLFDISHKIWERYVDLDWKLRDDNLESQKKRALEILKNTLNDLEKLNNSWILTLWTQDLVWWLSDELEDIIWNAKSFVK